MPRLDELFEEDEVFRFHLGYPTDHLRAAGNRSPEPFEDRCQHESADIDSPFLERFHARSERNLAYRVVNEIVRRGAGEVLLRVVDDLVRPQRLHQFQIRGAAYPGDVRPEILGKLDGRSPQRSGGPIDENALSPPNIPFSKEVQRTSPSPGDGGGFLEGQVRRLQCARTPFKHTCVLRIRAWTPPEDFVAHLESFDILSHGFYFSGEVRPKYVLFWSCETHEKPYNEGVLLSYAHVPGGYGGREYPDQ